MIDPTTGKPLEFFSESDAEFFQTIKESLERLELLAKVAKLDRRLFDRELKAHREADHDEDEEVEEEEDYIVDGAVYRQAVAQRDEAWRELKTTYHRLRDTYESWLLELNWKKRSRSAVRLLEAQVRDLQEELRRLEERERPGSDAELLSPHTILGPEDEAFILVATERDQLRQHMKEALETLRIEWPCRGEKLRKIERILLEAYEVRE